MKLPDDGSAATARVRFSVSDPGPRVLRFRVAPQDGELVTENNAREAMIDVRDRKEKILYFEGEPRSEVGFIRRAVQDDPNLLLVVLQRTADNKYMRLGVDNPDELVAGFPKTREELFSYRGLILGSIEAGAFTGDQLRMICRVRRSARRRAADVRRRARVLGGRLCRHQRGRGAAARPRSIGARTAARAADGQADPRGRRSRRHADCGDRSAVGREVELPRDARAEGDDAQSRRCDQAGRDDSVERHRRVAPRAAGARLPAIRARQSVCAPAAGLVALADARRDPRRGSDARILLAAAAAFARRRRARRRRAAVAHRSRRAGRERSR